MIFDYVFKAQFLDRKSIVQSFGIHSNLFGYMCEAHFLAVEIVYSALPFISGLFSPVSPSAVIGRIRAIVIDSIKRFTGWSRPHIGQIVFKFKPSLAHLNTSAAIIFIRRIIWITASIMHCGPGLIIFGSIHTVFFPKRTTLPTALGLSITKSVALNPLSSSAFTFTKNFFWPFPIVLFSDWAKYVPSIKFTAYDIVVGFFYVCHDHLINSSSNNSKGLNYG